MTKFTRTFTSGRMNKTLDERVVPNGEYIDAMNVRMGSTEQSEVGVIENTKGNVALTSLAYTNGQSLSVNAKCIGAYEDSARETIYWFVHDPTFGYGPTSKLDLIVSYNVYTDILTYHVISINDGSNINTTLNFNYNYLITGVNLVEDLLFFTDDYNQPRFINVRRGYPTPIADIDQFSAESILVIKKPPTEAPTVQPTQTLDQSNYLDTRFISFAYRYRYIDGEYSATSQWSEISFVPGPFNFSPDTYLNEGMVNTCNAAEVTYNSGGPLVVGIDLLFKQSNNNVIKVIEKLDKSDLGLLDNTDYQYTFINSKIFTVLTESELLRLYDNVPRLAKAQTIMGNRLMYGNYVEGYDLLDFNGAPLRLEYTTELISETINILGIDSYFSTSDYTIDGLVSVNDSVLNIDLTGIPLVQGSAISIRFKFIHSQFSGTPPFPSFTTTEQEISFSIFLQQSYNTVYDFAISSEFQNIIGTALNIKPVYSPVPGAETSCDGFKVTDKVNCIIPNILNAPNVQKYESGISAPFQPIEIIPPSITSPTVIGLKLIAMKFVDNVVTPTQDVYEYYKFTYSNVAYQGISTPKSLHSNRGYEIGIVYMDEFNRATTALVSPNNTEYVPCAYSGNQNSIRVTIPITQIAPAWATRYKFVCKADLEGYDTIFSNIFFTSPSTNDTYFLLEGENTRKVNIGDKLIVKSDTNGIVNDCVNTVVLDKEAKGADFLPGAPQGVYMKLSPNNFSVAINPNAWREYNGGTNTYNSVFVISDIDPSTPGMYTNVTIPQGSVINIKFSIERAPYDSTFLQDCLKRKYTFNKTYISNGTYANIWDWFVNDDISPTLSTGVSDNGPGELDWNFLWNQTYSGNQPALITTIPNVSCLTIQYFFIYDPTYNIYFFVVGGGCMCEDSFGTTFRIPVVSASITVQRAINTCVFETMPVETLPDVFFENHLSFPIINGYHQGNVQNQNATDPAIIDTGFFNCFTFGNGTESYKINDSIVGNTFNLGERVTSVSAQDYKAADRFADITYSGVYNTESNVNKLNEFNLGLLNYKYLEVSFGEIFVLDGRQTDVLVLQEDRVSYVLAGKNLLSDAAAGGAITSVPEVLGTQIARTEKYGVSFNPESYVQWGYDRYFTDAKRGAVLQIRGDSYQSDQLKVVSEQGMRTWFRDMFNSSFNTQKLGGFDPYMNEYVLSPNDTLLPITQECLPCGTIQTFNISQKSKEAEEVKYCVDLTEVIGEVVIEYNVTSIDGTFAMYATYNASSVATPSIDSVGSGTLDFYKDTNYIENADITITVTGNVVVTIKVNCPVPQPMNVIEIVVTANYQATQMIHAEYRYTNGLYTSPQQSNLVTLVSGTNNPLVSRYQVNSGYTGNAGFPPPGSNMTIRTNKISPDNFNFDPTKNKLRYLRSSTLYSNTPVDVQSAIDASTIVPLIVSGPNIYSGDFYVPSDTLGENLYLIWDLRCSTSTEMCYYEEGEEFVLKDICCNCFTCLGISPCVSYKVKNLGMVDLVVSFPSGTCGSLEPYILTVPVEGQESICVNNGSYTITEGYGQITQVSCNCECTEICWQWVITVPNGSAVVRYDECFGVSTLVTVVEDHPVTICAKIDTEPVVVAGTAELSLDMSCGCGL